MNPRVATELLTAALVDVNCVGSSLCPWSFFFSQQVPFFRRRCRFVSLGVSTRTASRFFGGCHNLTSSPASGSMVRGPVVLFFVFGLVFSSYSWWVYQNSPLAPPRFARFAFFRLYFGGRPHVLPFPFFDFVSSFYLVAFLS